MRQLEISGMLYISCLTVLGWHWLLLVGWSTILRWIIFKYYEVREFTTQSLFAYYQAICTRLKKVLSREWFYTTNHKKLGIWYILFAVISSILGTSLASLIRFELSQPGSYFFGNNGGSYHIVVAAHAILMVFFVVTPIVFGGFGNYFLPTQVGSRDVAYPRLNNFSVWLLPAGIVGILRALWDGMRVGVSKFVADLQFSGREWEKDYGRQEISLDYGIDTTAFKLKSYSGGGVQSSVYLFEPTTKLHTLNTHDLTTLLPVPKAAVDVTMTMAGWTFTTPFSHSRFTGRAVDISLAGLIFATITSIFTTINLISSWRFLRGRGARYQKELFPIFLIAAFISLRLLLLVSPILTAGFVMLLADRHFLTAFFTIRAGGDVLLFQHIFWFFGHPEVYILVIPGFGVASTIIPYYVKKPISSKMHMVYAMHAIGSMSLVVWGHHMYLVGIDSKARTLFMTITIMIGLPSTLKICGWIVSAANGFVTLSLEFWLVMIFVSIFFVGGMSGLMVAGAGLDILLHDTYYVVGHFHVMLSGAMILSLIGWIYFNFREFFGLAYSWIFASIHLGLHVIGHLFCFIPMLWLGYAGMPRRVHDYPYGYSGWQSVSSFGHSLVLLGLNSFLILIMHMIYFKRPLTARHLGLPFIIARCIFLVAERVFTLRAYLNPQFTGSRSVRKYLIKFIS